MADILVPDMGLVLVPRGDAEPPRLPQTPDLRLRRAEVAFNGAMMLDEDPLKIGAHNFADLQNFRYRNNGVEGVNGYTRLTTTLLAGAIRNGHQIVKTLPSGPVSTVLVQANGQVFPHTAVVPAAGEFGAALWTDSAGAGLGRLSAWPDGVAAYTNGVDSAVWGTAVARIGAFINYDDPTTLFRYDYTDRVVTTLTTVPHIAPLVRDAGNDIWLLVGSTRPVQGLTFTLGVVNTGAATTTVEYWNGIAWVAVSALVDGTLVGANTFGQSGTLTFTSTVATARVRYLDQRLLYYYRLKLGATGTPDATITVTGLTVDTPMQPIVDIWDGIERHPIMYYLPPLGEFTFEVQDESFSNAPIAAPMLNNAQISLGFEERQMGIRLRLLGNGNTNAATVAVAYWNGTTYAALAITSDTTSLGGNTFSHTGEITWNPPPVGSEFPLTTFGRTGYFYLVTFSAPLSFTATAPGDPVVDTVTGIPAQRWSAMQPFPGYRFPFVFAGRAMVAGLTSTGELNRIDYTPTGQPDVWNGKQSSAQGQEITVGGEEALTCAVEMSNRYAGVLTAFAVVLKAAETWVLQGNTPDTFSLYRINDVVGCPAPLSLTTAELTPTPREPIPRTIALWCSQKGPVYCDGSTIVPLRFEQPDGFLSSVDAYFTPADPRCVNPAQWELVSGWYDAQHSEYNLLLPSGATQSTINTWLVCDLLRRKWFRKVPLAYPQVGWQVQAVLGTPYVYAGGTDGGLLRLEDGTTWGGIAAITHILTGADLVLEGDGQTGSTWDETLLRYLKVLAVAESGATATVVCAHAPNGTGTFTTWDTLTLAVGAGRWNRSTKPVNLRAFSHQFQFTCATTDKDRAPRLLGLGILHRTERQTLTDAT